MRGHQADDPHLNRPFPIVVASPAGFAMMVLPLVHHFMYDGRQYRLDRLGGKCAWFRAISSASSPVRRTNRDLEKYP
jgi:hypothetical protein